MDRHWLSLLLPHPEDKSPGMHKPVGRKVGEYTLEREVPDTLIRIIEPGEFEQSYLMEFFECERFLKAVLKIEETSANRILDTVWQFGKAIFHVDEPEVCRSR